MGVATQDPDRMVRALARRWANGDGDLEDDLVAVGRVAVMESGKRWADGRGWSRTTWAYNPVRWAMGRVVRRHRVRRVPLSESLVASTEDEDDILARIDAERGLGEAQPARPTLDDVPWHILTPRQRECLLLRARLGSRRKVAEAMGTTPASVTELTRRAVERLRAAINETPELMLAA